MEANEMVTENSALESDVIVVGYGGAGAAAAITAHDNGAKVLILEKTSEIGGDSRLSGGNMAIPKHSQDYGKFAEYLKDICYKTTEPPLIDAYANGLKEIPDWLSNMGCKLAETIIPVSYTFNVFHPTHPRAPSAKGLEIIEISSVPTEEWPGLAGGVRVCEILAKQVERRAIQVMLSTLVKQLVKNKNGEIDGVIAESQGKELTINAKKAIILTCGGFENNDTLKWDNLEPKPLSFKGSPSNTGDGIRMVQKIGAGLWHMTRQISGLGFRPSGFEAAFAIHFLSPNFIYVDKHGRRFANETAIEGHEFGKVCSYFDDGQYFDYPRAPFYVIFDEQLRRMGPLAVPGAGYNSVVKKYKWSLDNSAEVDKGWIIKAKNIPELAKRLNMDAPTLENTVKQYNDYCNAGQDAEFGRSKEALEAVERPPYYAVEAVPALSFTLGGARRDEQARVLDTEGKPIPGLYAAGQFGSIWGFRYEAGTSFAEALVYGRIAGKNAALSSSRESHHDNG
jgi:succinate dehydrogenase/fumarate reductase flavoprotein subunit